MTNKAYGALLTSAISSVLACSGALAQQASSTAAGNGKDIADLSEIVVTANKRAERLQDVAMAVSAISGADLTARHTLDLQDLARQVPGLNLAQGGYGGVSNRIILRGLNTGNSGATVASVIDDTPFSLSGTVSTGADFGTDFDTYDLNRIEVLKGPQGSLYGATAEGGLIKYVTNAPDPSAFHAGFEAGALSFDHGGSGGSGKGYVNLPMAGGNAALRVTGYYERSPGWVDNALAGGTNTNSFKRYGGRISYLWNPTTDLSIRATAIIRDKKADDIDNVEVNGYKDPSNPFGLLAGYKNKNSFLLQPNTNRTRLYTLNVSYNLHAATLQSITSYGTIYQNFATDGTFYGYFNNALGIFGRPNTTLTQFGNYGMKKFSQELRLSSDPGSTLFAHAFDWQAGLFFTREQAAGLNHYVTRDYPSGAITGTPLSPDPEVFFTDLPSTYKEMAGYGDATYHFTDKFDVEAGARVFNNKEHATQTEGGALFGFPIADFGELKSSETDWTFSVAPRYHLTPDQMIYARIASGYRPGGPEVIIPGGPPGLPTQFGSDSTINYEVGFKGSLFERKLNVDLTAFYIDWSKVQVQVIIPVVGGPGGGAAYPSTQNVGKAKSQGFEWTLSWIPVTGLTLGTSGALTDAKLKDDATGNGAKSGDVLPYVAKVNAGLTADYEYPIASNVSAYVGAGWNYVGKRFSDFNLDPTRSHLEIPAYRTYDARAGVRFERYSVELYGKNLGKEDGVTYYGQGSVIFGIDNPAVVNLIRPRTFGLRVTADF